MEDFEYLMPTRVVFGNGCLDNLADHVTGENVLIVTGSGGAMKKTGVLKRVKCLLDGSNVKVFDKVEADPSLETVDAGAAICEGMDSIIALGGGSPMDAAKGIAACIGNECSAKDVLYKGKFKKSGPPIIAVPTTSGTGSEVTQVAVLSDREMMIKKSFRHESVYPRVAICDPELTVTMPKKITAQTGLDALSHALEALVAKKSQPITDTLCIEATKLILESLEGAYEFPTDMTFRKDMMLASLLAGFGITVAGAGLSHGLSYGVWKVTGMGHGLAVGLLTPHVMRFNIDHDVGKYLRCARACGYQSTQELIERIEMVNDALDVPKSLGAAGVNKDDMEALIATSLAGSARGNPRKVGKREAKKFIEGLI